MAPAQMGMLVLLSMLVLQTDGFALDAEPDEVGLNHRAWNRPSAEVGQMSVGSKVSPPKNRRKTVELLTGMNRKEAGLLVPSEARFEDVGNAFIAAKLQHRVTLSKDIYQGSAVTVMTRDGVVLKSTPLAIGLYDTASGRSSIIAFLTNSIGLQIESNLVIYPNAFHGVCADVNYRVGLGTFEQDVVITERLDPADFGFPEATSQLQIYTEFYGDVPEPERLIRPIRVEKDKAIRAARVDPDLVDEVLGFGEFVLGTGKAMAVENPAGGGYDPGAPVAKRLVSIQGRRFLIETVDYGPLKQRFAELPECQLEGAAVKKKSAGSLLSARRGYGRIPRLLPAASLGTGPGKAGLMASRGVYTRKPGIVIDYIATIGGTLSTPVVFQGDCTYLIAGLVVANGSVLVEGGSVIKYKHLSPASASIKCISGITFKSTRFQPAFFTAVDDDSVGESMNGFANSGYTSSPHQIYTDGYANPAIWLSYSGGDLSHARFRYCQEAIRFEGPQLSSVRNTQLVQCIRGVMIVGSGSGSGLTTTIENCLFSGITSPLNVQFDGAIQNVYTTTLDGSATLVASSSVGQVYANFYNSIFANITTLSSGAVILDGYNNGFFATAPFGATASRWIVNTTPFQSSGLGNYYLPAGHSFRDVGTAVGLSSALLTELKQTTSDAPPSIVGAVGGTTILKPKIQVFRDVDVPNLGYHYPILDTILNNASISAKLVLTNGVSVGLFGQALDVLTGGHVLSEGTADSLNSIASVANVQEQPVGTSSPSFIRLGPGSGNPQLEFRFTDFSVGQGRSGTLLDAGAGGIYPFDYLVFKDSRLRRPAFDLRPVSVSNVRVAITNCVLERARLALGHTAAGVNTALSAFLYNNTFVGNPSSLTPGDTPALRITYDLGTINPTWQVRDNLFDKANQVLEGTGTTTVLRSNNAFTSGTPNSLPGSGGDQMNFTLNYAVGVLGEFYVPSTASTIIDKGSRAPSAAGLFHYTTRNTAGSKEGLGAIQTVDIGFHYVGATSTGQPLDFDSDGLGDYYEDRNGNATYDVGQDPSNWQAPDTDGDGMPDGWEFAYGLNPLLNDANGDPDEDLLSNLWEYQLGLNPTINQAQDPSSRRNYGYDLLNRLRTGTGRASITLGVDVEGNITTVTP